MGAFYPTSTLLRNQTQLQLRIYIADKLYKDWSNLNDIESDTLQTCRDIYNTMNNSTRWQTIGRVQSCSVTKFINRGGDEVAGHEMTMNFLIRDRDGVCGLPMGSYDFDQITGSLCSPVQIYEDGILIDTIPSGGIYNVVGSPATQIITDSEGNELYNNSIPSGATETQVIQDSDVTVNGNAFDSILAEGSLDVPVVNEGTNPVGTITGGEVVIANSEVTINTIQVGDIPAEDNLSIAVTLDGTPAGTWNAGTQTWEVVGVPAPSDFRPNKSGVVISYADYDGGYYQRGRDVSFYKLSSNNPYGNIWRFTGIGGGYYDHDTSQYKDINGTVTTLALAYPDNIMIDWNNRTATAVMLWRFTTSGISVKWDTARTQPLTLTIGGLSTWYLPETVDYDTLRNWGNATHFQWLPINTTDVMWTANTNPSSTTIAWYVNKIQFSGSGKANLFQYLPCRFTLLSEIGL